MERFTLRSGSVDLQGRDVGALHGSRSIQAQVVDQRSGSFFFIFKEKLDVLKFVPLVRYRGCGRTPGREGNALWFRETINPVVCFFFLMIFSFFPLVIPQLLHNDPHIEEMLICSVSLAPNVFCSAH